MRQSASALPGSAYQNLGSGPLIQGNPVIRTTAHRGAAPLIRTRFSGGWGLTRETSLSKGVHGQILVERTREVKAIGDAAIRVRPWKAV